MASRGRDGTNTVTVTPTTVAPGGKVTIRVTASQFVGVLGTVYSGQAQIGTHAPPAGAKACMGSANAITHSAPFASTTSLSWEYTVPATASGTLEARVVTLNGAAGGSTQKFAVGKASFTVVGGTPTAATTSTTTTTTTTTTTSTSTTTSTTSTPKPTTTTTSTTTTSVGSTAPDSSTTSSTAGPNGSGSLTGSGTAGPDGSSTNSGTAKSDGTTSVTSQMDTVADGGERSFALDLSVLIVAALTALVGNRQW
jgi:hypothetical protein